MRLMIAFRTLSCIGCWFTEVVMFLLCRGCLLWHGVDGGEDGSEGI